ncbi:MAG: gliding motility-associated C-terminal domain-containing protein [Bacteroidota bacterium]
MRKLLLLLIWILCGFGKLYAQVANDACTNAFLIPEVSDWCSLKQQFTNVEATPTNWINAPICQSGSQDDVWFTFVAIATDVTLVVRGDTDIAPGGTLPRPEVALFSTDCNSFSELQCNTDLTGSHIVELYKGGLIVGATYAIQVQGRNGRQGTFQLCINNYYAPGDPNSDCPTAVVLCDTEPFVVQAVTGAGLDTREMDDASCFSGPAANIDTESNSTWFTWVCDESGTLEFSLSPLSEEDDLDFVVYELPNGLTDCSGKRILRCMASGDFVYPSRCMGTTGLRAGSTDDSENANCLGADDDNYLRPIRMRAGVAYALVVNNFTSSGNGFAIEFGGTGTFLGPDAEVVVGTLLATSSDVICSNHNIIVSDISEFPLGSIESWEWVFGVGATPATASGRGPHLIQYNDTGLKSVLLTITTDLGCKISEDVGFEVFPSVDVTSEIVQPSCSEGTDGAIRLDISGGTPPYDFLWQSEMPLPNQSSLTDLVEGDYIVRVVDSVGCQDSLMMVLREPGFFVTPTLPVEPTCFGLSDGQLTVAASDGTPPYEFDIGNGFTLNSTFSNLGAGTYIGEVRDAEGCDETFEVTVGQPDSLALNISAADISCFGEVDGVIQISPSGGTGAYTYTWSDALTGTQNSSLTVGTYQVSVVDANGCITTDEATISEPPAINFRLEDVLDAICYQEPSGQIVVSAQGGTPPFRYSTDGITYQDSDSLSNLLAGNYIVYVRDSRDCSDTFSTMVGEPDPFFVDAGADLTIDLGSSTTLSATTNPPDLDVEMVWENARSLDCDDCPNPTATPVRSTAYTVLIEDDKGCIATDRVRVEVRPVRPIYQPNIFSPNSETSGNDKFTLYGGIAATQINVLRIYDRWGNLVYEVRDIPHSDPTVGWDGTYKGVLMDAAVFAYYAEVAFVDGVVRTYKGDVTLLR